MHEFVKPFQPIFYKSFLERFVDFVQDVVGALLDVLRRNMTFVLFTNFEDVEGLFDSRLGDVQAVVEVLRGIYCSIGGAEVAVGYFVSSLKSQLTGEGLI